MASSASPTRHITTSEIGSEQLLVGLREGHPLAGVPHLTLDRLSDRALGMHPAHLFPAWHAVQREILADAGVTPPIMELEDTDLTARRWTHQPEIEWVMLIGSLLNGHEQTVTRPVRGRAVPFTLSWHTRLAQSTAVQRFVRSSLSCDLPAGWIPSGGSS